MSIKNCLLPAIAAASIVVASAQAQTTPPATPEAKSAEPAAPAPPPPIFSIWGFDLTGHVDVGYSYLSGSGKFVSGVNDRVFDYKHDSVYFHALDLTFTNTPDNGWGGLVDVTIGKDADAIAAYGTISKSKGPANARKSSRVMAIPITRDRFCSATPFHLPIPGCERRTKSTTR